MFKELQKLRPFRISVNRHHGHFQDIAILSLTGLDMGKFLSRLEKHKRQIGMA